LSFIIFSFIIIVIIDQQQQHVLRMIFLRFFRFFV